MLMRLRSPPYCSAKWKDALAVCRENLSELDLELLKNIDTYRGFKRRDLPESLVDWMRKGIFSLLPRGGITE